jgi:hypothetical protein
MEAWNDILALTASVRNLNFEETGDPLVVNEDIRPNLPTAEHCLRTLMARRRQAISPYPAKALQARIHQLRERVLLGYTEIVSQLSTSGSITGLDALHIQKEHSRSMEVWFDRAAGELFAAYVEQSEVRESLILILLLDSFADGLIALKIEQSLRAIKSSSS